MNGSMTMTKSWVFRLIVINVAIFLIQLLTEGVQVVRALGVDGQQVPMAMPFMIHFFGLTPTAVIDKYYVWQVVSYMFLHGGLIHLLFNMYALFFFGLPIEQTWGSRRFLVYYFFTGVGAGLLILGLNMFLGGAQYYSPTIGASGAVFGILLAFGMLFPDVELMLIFFPVPIKAKYMVTGYGLLEVFLLVFNQGGGNISHIGHVGGLIFGLLYFLLLRKHGLLFKTKIIRAKMSRNNAPKETVIVQEQGKSNDRLFGILQRVKSGGADALNDDEYQYIRYLEIMRGESDNLCVDEDFSGDDQYCRKCADYEACMIREIKKYL